MTRRFVFTVVIVFILLLVGTTFYLVQQGPRLRTMALAITGDAGREVMGYVIVDGVKQRLEGKLPVNLSYQGHKFEFVVFPATSDSTNSITVATTMEGNSWGSATASGVRGAIEQQPGFFPFSGSGSVFIGGMSDNEIADLRKNN
jgi:hypothetical protein